MDTDNKKVANCAAVCRKWLRIRENIEACSIAEQKAWEEYSKARKDLTIEERRGLDRTVFERSWLSQS